MRGKACLPYPQRGPEGITPACAGKSSSSIAIATSQPGSPPHVRGKASNLRFCRQCEGDHPRMCGEKRPGGHRAGVVQGSPPHVRGKVHDQEIYARLAGITPACAGKRLKRSRSTVPHAAIVPLFPSVCNKPAGSDGSPAGHDAPPFLPIENAVPASPAYNLRSL